MRIAPFLLFAFLLSPVQAAFADQVAKYKPPKSFETTEDFFVIEGAGLFQSGSADALDADMWRGSSRSDVSELLKAMPMHSKSRVFQALMEKILLSESNTEQLNNYTDVAPGEDLLTLRIHKLMQGGFFDEALELYSVAIESPHHADIAKAGILAMLGAGEKSIACLEMKTLGNMNGADPFWSDFNAYCHYTLSERNIEASQKTLESSQYSILRSLAFNKNFILPYTAESFAALSLLERQVLVAEKRIEAPALNPQTLSDIPPHDISMLLSLGTYNEGDTLLLALKAAEFGIISTQELADMYDTVQDPSLLGGLPSLYQKLQEETSPDIQRSLLINALNLQDQYGDYALIPFAKDLATWNGVAFEPQQMTQVLGVIYLAQVDIEADFVENYLADFENKPQNEALFKSLTLLKLMVTTPQKHDFSQIVQNLSIFHKSSQNEGTFVIENLDNKQADVDNAAKVYEKGLDAATQKEHVVVSKDLRDEISRKSKAGSLGETVLLSINMLRAYPDRVIGKDLYEDVKKALEDVKLNKFSHKLAIESLVGDNKDRN